MTSQSASRDVSTWAELIAGPDRLPIALYGRCFRGVDSRIVCTLDRVELDGRDITTEVREKYPAQVRSFEVSLVCEYVAGPYRRHIGATDAWAPEHDDGPGAA